MGRDDFTLDDLDEAVFEASKRLYRALLNMPFEHPLRHVHNTQFLMANLVDYIAEHEGLSPEHIQTSYEREVYGERGRPA